MAPRIKVTPIITNNSLIYNIIVVKFRFFFQKNRKFFKFLQKKPLFGGNSAISQGLRIELTSQRNSGRCRKCAFGDRRNTFPWRSYGRKSYRSSGSG